MTEESQPTSHLLRAISLVGLVAILILGAWGIIRIGYYVPTLLNSVGSGASSLFAPKTNQSSTSTPLTTTQAPAEHTASNSNQTPTYIPVSVQQPPKTTVTKKSPARATFYGLPDVAVHIVSVVPSGNHYSVEFMVENIGTNTMPAQWTFTALLPLSPVYTYQSSPQLALYPGDKMLYTLSVTMDNADQYYPFQYNNQNYSNCSYTQNYIYDGLYNYPSTSFGCTQNNNYGLSAYQYNTDYRPYQINRTFSITVDPQNYVRESNKANNIVTVSI